MANITGHKFINKKNALVVAKGIYLSLGLTIVYRYGFVDSINRGLIAGLSFFGLGFPLSFFSTYGIALPLMVVDWISGGAIEEAFPDFFHSSLIALICAANFCVGYYQWFVLAPRFWVWLISGWKARRWRD